MKGGEHWGGLGAGQREHPKVVVVVDDIKRLKGRLCSQVRLNLKEHLSVDRA
jgi:hypothetical protein